jgi:PKD repeat protein
MKFRMLYTLLPALFFYLALPGNGQVLKTGKGKPEFAARVSFQDIVEYDALFPVKSGKGRRIENAIRQFPEMPVDMNKIVFSEPARDKSEVLLLDEPSPLPEIDFHGLEDSGSSIPPDVNGAVGPYHMMITLNTQIRIMERDGTPISTVSTGSFWHPLPGSGGVFDPKIYYDPYENRWILAMPSFVNPNISRLMVAVSETNDPTGNWFMYTFDGNPTDDLWFDYPNYGFNKKWLVVSGNMVDAQPVYAALYIFNIKQLYEFNPGVEFTRYEVYDGFSLIPSATFDKDEEDIYIVDNTNGNLDGKGYIHLRKVTGQLNNPQLMEIGYIEVPDPWEDWSYFNNGDFAPQLGSDQKFNTVDARFQYMIFRNNKLWCTQHIYLPADNPTRSSVQWWQLTPTGEILQRGRVDDATGYNFCAFTSIAVNAMEDVMIGYASFSPGQYAGGSYVFRYADDPLNTMRQPHQYIDGLAPYYKTFGGLRNRWGDYTSTVVDPVNDLDFWTLQQYAELPGSQDHWGTWWAMVNVEAAPEAAFSSNITQVPVGSGVNFIDQSKFEPSQWQWLFDGGSPASSTDQNPENIVYEETGYFNVTLIVSNNQGSDTLVAEGYINANTTILPEVIFSVSDTIPCLGDTVNFTDHSVYNPVAWLWEFTPDYVIFADGSDATSQHPNVIFEYPFTYQVTLTATNNNGSASITKEAMIKAGGEPLPFVETFEAWSLDRLGWLVENPDNNKTWESVPVLGSSPGGMAAYVNIKNYAAFGQRDRLISPPLNFYSHKDIVLTFEHAYAQRFPQYTDSLIVYISSDCGFTWERLTQFGEDGSGIFATSDPTSLNYFPESPDDWCGAAGNPECTSIDLSGYSGQSNIRIMFESFNGFGNNLFIDNVTVTGEVSGIGNQKPDQFSLVVFPNPSSGLFTVYSGKMSSETKLRIINLSGIIVLEKYIPAEGNLNLNFDITGQKPGVYLLEIRNSNKVYFEKVILQ